MNPDLQPYQQRVMQEREELEERRSALDIFIASPTFQALCPHHQSLLRKQSVVMWQYSCILRDRINAS